MVFIYRKPEVMQFWMKNVPFSIDIGFFDSRGKLTSFETMAGTSPMQKENTLPTYSSKIPVQFAVEVEEGFFSRLSKGQKSNCVLAPLPSLKHVE